MSNWEKLKKEIGSTKPTSEIKKSEGIQNKTKKKTSRPVGKRARSASRTASEEVSKSKKPCQDGLWFKETVTCSSSIPVLESDPKALVTGTDSRVTKCIAMDCEMVGAGSTKKDQYDMLARCSIVNSHGSVLYDKYVSPMDNIVDYRTHVSGITPQHLQGSLELSVVQKEVSELLKGQILVGHALHHDLKALFLSHPSKDTRDTSGYKKFRDIAKGKSPSLKRLAEAKLGIVIQHGSHDSVEDARVAMKLYKLVKTDWEKSQRIKFKAAKTKRPCN